MKRVRLVTIAVVVATIAGAGGFAGWAYWTYFPPNPYVHISLVTMSGEYALGDTVTFVVGNRGGVGVNFLGWTVHRFVEGEWAPAECHVSDASARPVPAFGQHTYQWGIFTPDPVFSEAYCGGVLSPLEAGLYRGVARVLAEGFSQVEVFGEFVVT